MPKPIKKRLVKKTVATEEEVSEKLSHLRDTLRERQKLAVKFLALILVVLLTIAGIFIYSHNAGKKAGEYTSQAYRIYHSTDPGQFPQEQDRYLKALELFQKAYDTKKSPISLFYIAACYDELGRYDDALKSLRVVVKKYSGKEKFLPLAYQKIAAVSVKTGDLDGALKALDSLIALKSDMYKDFALMEYGRILEKMEKTEDAREKYQELLSKYPESVFNEEASAKTGEKGD